MTENHRNRQHKGKQTAEQLVDKMKREMGVTFSYADEKTAEQYMRENNKFLRVASYRKNFTRDERGHYVGLDFGCLMELAELDRQMRNILLALCLDLEHYLKVKLLADIEEDPTTDGYDIVEEYLDRHKSAIAQMELNAGGVFTADLIDKYFHTGAGGKNSGRQIIDHTDCPAWVLVEVLNMNHLLQFYEDYYESREKTHLEGDITACVRVLRNACAHNNCILANFEAEQRPVPKEIKSWLEPWKDNPLLTARPLLEIACLLYSLRTLMRDRDGGRSFALEEKENLRRLYHLLKVRFLEHREWFGGQERLGEAYTLAVWMMEHL